MKIVSLFSGAGGLDLGLLQAGHEVIWANDIDPDSCATYAHNIGNHVVCADIASVPTSDIPDCDVVVGGFPCQGFSMANRLRSPGDSRNTLYRELFRVIRDKKPRYFLAENVRGILSLDQGNAIRQIIEDFESIGYRVTYKAFNTADFGVPQLRVRVIIAGTRADLPPEFDYQHPTPTHGKAERVSIGEALADIPEPNASGNDELLNHVFSKYKVTDRNFTGHRRTDPTKPSPTILARGNGKGGVCAIQHPGNHRRMSVRESAAVQTFPLNFDFQGSMSSMYRQVGNAVPPLFGMQLGLQLKEVEEAVCV